MQDELKLTMEQQQKLLAARRQLLSQLEAIRQHRETFVLAVGLLLMQRIPVRISNKLLVMTDMGYAVVSDYYMVTAICL